MNVIFDEKKYMEFLKKPFDRKKMYKSTLTGDEITIANGLLLHNISAEEIKTLSRYKLWKRLYKPYQYDPIWIKSNKPIRLEEDNVLQNVLDFITGDYLEPTN